MRLEFYSNKDPSQFNYVQNYDTLIKLVFQIERRGDQDLKLVCWDNKSKLTTIWGKIQCEGLLSGCMAFIQISSLAQDLIRVLEMIGPLVTRKVKKAGIDR